MTHMSKRTLRGLAEAIGIPSVICGIATALLILHQIFSMGV